VRVLDLTWAWAGPFATMLLADLGAEVVNVEWDPRPSNLRVQPPLVDKDAVDGGAWWSANQRNKLSIGIDLKRPEGRQIVLDLAAMSDIAIDNFSAGVVDRLGVGYDDLAGVNRSLVYVSMSAYGAHGPCAHYLGYGTQLYTASGFANLTGRKPDIASLMGIPLPDPISGLAGAVAAVSTLHRALTTGRGGHLDVSELEATCMVLRDGLTGRRSSYELASAGDGGGEQVVVRQGSAEERVAGLGDVLEDPWLGQRGFWHEDPHLAPRSPGLRIGAPPFLVDGARPPIWCGAPRLFSGTERVLQGLLGWDDAQVAAATAAGFVRCAP
jgi:crotonobetainyl-CoA:carnitine CoA-transferase CaiB-like acyl-CoA transferase